MGASASVGALILPNHTSGRDTLRHYWSRQFRGVTKRSQTRPREMHKILCIRGSALWRAAGMVMSELELHVQDEQIIVNMPETRLTMTYQASSDAPWLIELPFWTCDDRTAPISVNDFRGRAWQAANKKARELGWIAEAGLFYGGGPRPSLVPNSAQTP